MTEPDRDAQERTAQDLLKRYRGNSYHATPHTDGTIAVGIRDSYGGNIAMVSVDAKGGVTAARPPIPAHVPDLPEAPARHIDAQTFAQRELVWLSRDDADLAARAIIALLTLADEMTDLLKVDPIPRRGDLERIADTLADGNR